MAQHHAVSQAAAAEFGHHFDPFRGGLIMIDAEAVHAEDAAPVNELHQVIQIITIAAVSDDHAGQIDALVPENRLLLQAPFARGVGMGREGGI